MDAIDRLTQRAALARIPLHAIVELTWQCNFRCLHCYQEGLRELHDELATGEWKQLLDELAGMGCLFLVLTGGEALVRKDFAEIYRHAVSRGFIITVFSNGSLIDDELLALWTELPPRKVEMTLYGMSAEKYREVTGQAKGFAHVMTAIERLGALGVRVELKAPAMRPLLDDLDAMAGFAAARGLSFRTDPGLFPRLDGDPAPLAYRLSPEEVVALEAARPGFTEALDACFAEAPDLGERVYRCGAGSNTVTVNPSGHFEACPISRATSIDWREHGTQAAWQGLAVEAARSHAKTAVTGGPGEVQSCGACSARGGCSRCPGKSWLETGDVERPVAQHCDVSLVKLGLMRRSA